LLLLALGFVSLTGVNWALPFMKGAPDVSRTDSAGVFALGVFSGAASACCAPVLAGALTLSALSPGLLGSAGVGMAYIFGMVFPLVLMTLAWDRLKPEHRALGSRRVSLNVGRLHIQTTRSGVAASIMFFAMAIVLLVVTFTGSSLSTGATAGMSRQIEGFLQPILARLEWIPDLAAGALLVAIAVLAIWLSARSPRPQADVPPTSHADHTAEEDHCHSSVTTEGH
jgi:hypothetical protein